MADLGPLFEGEDGLHKPSQVPSDPYFYDFTHFSNISLSPLLRNCNSLVILDFTFLDIPSILQAVCHQLQSGPIYIMVHLQPKGRTETLNHSYLPKKCTEMLPGGRMAP